MTKMSTNELWHSVDGRRLYVTLTMDSAHASALVHRAARNKSRRAVAGHGTITVEIREPNEWERAWDRYRDRDRDDRDSDWPDERPEADRDDRDSEKG